MVRWRFVLFLAMLMMTHVSSSEDPEEDNQDVEESDADDKDDDDDDTTEKFSAAAGAGEARKTPASTAATKVTRTAQKRPLECYVCSYKRDTPLQSCLDPSKFNVNTMMCNSQNEKCFTAAETKDTETLVVMRGCRSSCVGAPDVTCCETNRCNNQPFLQSVLTLEQSADKSSKSIHHSILYFVTILLLLQTVVKVNIL